MCGGYKVAFLLQSSPLFPIEKYNNFLPFMQAMFFTQILHSRLFSQNTYLPEILSFGIK
jgi:hypothetical protein